MGINVKTVSTENFGNKQIHNKTLVSILFQNVFKNRFKTIDKVKICTEYFPCSSFPRPVVKRLKSLVNFQKITKIFHVLILYFFLKSCNKVKLTLGRFWRTSQHPERCWQGVNFINILLGNFQHERCFGSFSLVTSMQKKLPKRHSYKKFVRKMLMKLTIVHNSRRSQLCLQLRL